MFHFFVYNISAMYSMLLNAEIFLCEVNICEKQIVIVTFNSYAII